MPKNDTWCISYAVTCKLSGSVLDHSYSQKLQSYYPVRRFMHFSMQHDSDPILTSGPCSGTATLNFIGLYYRGPRWTWPCVFIFFIYSFGGK